MNEKITGLEPGMTFRQVAAVVGEAAVFQVDGISAIVGSGRYMGETVRHGEGSVWGKTLTEPPLAWSIDAPTAGSFRQDQVLSPIGLQASRALLHTFKLEAPTQN